MFPAMRFFVRCSLILWLLLATISLPAKDVLTWQTDRDRVTADIQATDLFRVLEGVAKVTGWNVFVESNLNANVSVKFTELSSGDALRRLLGDLNYAFVPQTNGHARLFVFRTVRANATLVVRPGDLAGARENLARKIPNELVVRLKPGANIDEIARRFGAKVLGKIDGLNAYRLQFADEAAADAARAQLSASPDVASVENNFVVDQPPLPQKLDLAGAPGPVSLKLDPPSSEACRVIVGLIDTAVKPSGGVFDKFLLKSLSVAGDANFDPAAPTHGPSMLQNIVLGASSTSKGSSSMQVLSVDVYGPNETANTFNVAAGIAAAINNGANIINLSLGSPGDSQLLHDIIQQVKQKGIPVFAAAGNNASPQPFYPAAYPEVISVTAGRNGQLAPYANFADYIKLEVPGSAVVYFNNNAYVVNGTSTASALSSGLAAGAAAANCIGTGAAANGLLNTSALQFKPGQ